MSTSDAKKESVLTRMHHLVLSDTELRMQVHPFPLYELGTGHANAIIGGHCGIK